MEKTAESIVCGIDEVGRGPLAGPVVASAVILSSENMIPGLRDSKKLRAEQRETLAESIYTHALATGTAWIWHDEIDRINIHWASLSAMRAALDSAMQSFCRTPRNGETVNRENFMIRIDGKFVPDMEKSAFRDIIHNSSVQAIVKGDELIPAISAASIIAKVARDRWMTEYHKIEPQYGFDKHKGYPTVAHRAAIHRYGPSAIQRMTFKAG